MLRRDRQLRTQILQLRDAVLFAVGLFVAHPIREAMTGVFLWCNFDPISGFERFIRLYLIIIPGIPLILESQGFYQRPLLASRRETAWILSKGCCIAVLGLILVTFFFKEDLARGVVVLFGVVSFGFVMIAEEIMRVVYGSRFGQAQVRKRVI